MSNRLTTRLRHGAPDTFDIEQTRHPAVGDAGLVASVAWPFIQILIAYVSGQTLHDGEAMRDARENNADRDAQDKEAQTNKTPPRA